jgi:hypothetical protein
MCVFRSLNDFEIFARRQNDSRIAHTPTSTDLYLLLRIAFVRADRYVNMAMGGLLLVGVVQAGFGARQLMLGYGKKEGF